MKKIFYLLFGFILLFFGIHADANVDLGSKSQGKSQSTVACNDKGTSLLFVVHSPTGELIQRTDGMHLILHTNRVYYFTDRPERKSGAMNAQAFLKMWTSGANNFKVDNPNAALVSDKDETSINGKPNILVDAFVVLSTPVYTAKQGTLDFHVSSLNNNPKNLTLSKLGEISLFVDGWTSND